MLFNFLLVLDYTSVLFVGITFQLAKTETVSYSLSNSILVLVSEKMELVS